MIKRSVLFIVIILLCLFTIQSNCEMTEFLFRNGVAFGDTSEIVKEKEGLPSNYYMRNSYLTIEDLKLSGIPDSTLAYVFKYNKLSAIYIKYNEDKNINRGDEESSNEEYDIINDGLTKKYGAPVPNEQVVSYPNGNLDLYNKVDDEKELLRHNQYIVYTNNGKKVVIDHILYSCIVYNEWKYLDSDGHKVFRHYLTYLYLNINDGVDEVVGNDL